MCWTASYVSFQPAALLWSRVDYCPLGSSCPCGWLKRTVAESTASDEKSKRSIQQVKEEASETTTETMSPLCRNVSLNQESAPESISEKRSMFRIARRRHQSKEMSKAKELGFSEEDKLDDNSISGASYYVARDCLLLDRKAEHRENGYPSGTKSTCGGNYRHIVILKFKCTDNPNCLVCVFDHAADCEEFLELIKLLKEFRSTVSRHH